MTTREYICVECGGRDFEPHQGRDCRHCGRWHCLGCLPDHEGTCDRAPACNTGLQPVASDGRATSPSYETDRNGFSIERRYELILGFYLTETHLARAGHWDCKKIREWAEVTWLPLDVIRRGICRAVDRATASGHSIWAFGYIDPHLIAAARQYLEASAGLGPAVQRAAAEHPLPSPTSNRKGELL